MPYADPVARKACHRAWARRSRATDPERHRAYRKRHRAAHRTALAARYKKAKAKFSEWLAVVKAGPCMDCGRCFPPCAMDFDHVRGVKVCAVSRMIKCSQARLDAEVAKCDLVCAVCHRIRTQRRKGAVIE